MDPSCHVQNTTGTNLKASLRPVDKSKPPPKKPPQAPSSDAGGDISAPRLPPKPKREQARAIYDYKAQNDDELTIKKGDTIIILSKGVEDEGWWKGELNGKIGVFPDNYIEVIKPMDEVILPLRTKKPERLNEKPPPSTTATAGSLGGVIGPTNPTGSQSKLNSEAVRNNNNLKSIQQQSPPSSLQTIVTSTTNTPTTTTAAAAANLTSSSNISLTSSTTSNESSKSTSAINSLTSTLLSNSIGEEDNPSFGSPLLPSKKPNFRLPGAVPILPVTNLIKSSVNFGGSNPDVPSTDILSPTGKLDPSKESKLNPDEKLPSNLTENEVNLGSLDNIRRLNHPTANRVRGPNRRPPSMIVLSKEDTEDDLESFEQIKSESKLFSSSSSTNLNNTLATSSSASSSTTGSNNDVSAEKGPTIPPWMKELKRSQAERRNKNDNSSTPNPIGSDENSGANLGTPLSPTKSNPCARSLGFEANESNTIASSSTPPTTSSSPLTVNSSLPCKPLKAAKPSATPTAAAITINSTSTTTSTSTTSSSSNAASSTITPSPPKSSNIANKSADSSLPSINKGVSDFCDIQVELSNLKKSMVPRKDYEDLVKKVNELTDMVETVKETYGSVVRDLINQVAEARKNMATLEIEVDRLRKLSTTV